MTEPHKASSPIASRVRLMRVIGRPGAPDSLSPFHKTLLFFLALFVLSALLAWLDPRPTLRHVKLTMLSGAASGNYHATVDRLAAEVARRRGSIHNQTSAGSVENLQRLAAARHSCEAQFALVQAGTAIPEEGGLELLGRLPQPESLIILGRDVDRLHAPRDLTGMRIGIGPVGSGTEQMMRRLLAQVPELRLQVSTQSIDQQLDMLVGGELDLGAMDILPLPTWIQLGVALSVLFSAMAIGHRFNLWRIDVHRVKIEREIPALFHRGVTLGEIADMPPDARHDAADVRARLDALITRLEALAERCRRQSLSILVPMGAEMFYRYQESLIAELLYALRLYCERLPPPT